MALAEGSIIRADLDQSALSGDHVQSLPSTLDTITTVSTTTLSADAIAELDSTTPPLFSLLAVTCECGVSTISLECFDNSLCIVATVSTVGDCTIPEA
jgi:hypothetical protein